MRIKTGFQMFAVLIGTTCFFIFYFTVQTSYGRYPFHNEPCDRVHIAMAVSGHSKTWQSYLAIKSILMNEEEMIHFHFLVDSTAQTILQTMMSSWLLPGVVWSFYDNDESLLNSSPKSLNQLCLSSKEPRKDLVLALYNVLPEEVESIIIVQPNVLVPTSTYHLHKYMISRLKSNFKLIGFYSDVGITDVDTSASPVMALNMASIRSLASFIGNSEYSVSKCDLLWPIVSHKMELNSTFHLYAFPNRTASSSFEYLKGGVSLYQLSLFYTPPQDLLTTIWNYDGYHIRHRNRGICYPKMEGINPPSQWQRQKYKCAMLKWEGMVKKRICPFLLDYSYASTDPFDITLSTHTTKNRLERLEVISTHWDGPMSVAIHVKDSELLPTIEYILTSKYLSKRKNISYHFMFKVSSSYPANPMRNLAKVYIETPYIYYNDIDFIPSFGLYSRLKDWVKQTKNMTKKALVVPAFETVDPKFVYPKNRSEALSMYKKKNITMFHFSLFKAGHAPTNYTKWCLNTTKNPYRVKWKFGYEPYVVVKRPDLPFDDRFVDRQHNKLSFLEELNMAGYQFWVLPDVFLIHLPHKLFSLDQLQYPLYCYLNRYEEWLNEKKKQYKWSSEKTVSKNKKGVNRKH